MQPIVFLLIALLQVCASTDVTSDVTSDTTWFVSGSPYVISENINIADGVTLTVAPGVQVEFTTWFSRLTVSGALIAQGSPNSRISFTSGLPVQAEGDWAGIHFTGSSVGAQFDASGDYIWGGSMLRYVDLLFAGTTYGSNPTGCLTFSPAVSPWSVALLLGVYVGNCSSDAVNFVSQPSGDFKMVDSTFEGRVYVQTKVQARNLISNCTFQNTVGRGLEANLLDYSTLDIENSTFNSNGEEGLYLRNEGEYSVTNSVFSFNNRSGVRAVLRDGVVFENCTFSNNNGHGLDYDSIGTRSALDLYSSTFDSNAESGLHCENGNHPLRVNNNTFSNNLCGSGANAAVSIGGHEYSFSQMTGNSFSNSAHCPFEFEFTSGNPSDVYNARGNYWGTIDELTVRDNIWDFRHHISLPLVEYFPFCLSANCGSRSLTPNDIPFINPSNEIQGSVETNTVIPAGIYTVVESVRVLVGVTLTISPGTVLQFSPETGILVQGTLMAQGNTNNKITFTSGQTIKSAGDWSGISFDSTSVGASFDGSGGFLSGSILEDVEVLFPGAKSTPGIKFSVASVPLLSRVSVMNCTEAVLFHSPPDSSFQILDSIFEGRVVIKAATSGKIVGCSFQYIPSSFGLRVDDLGGSTLTIEKSNFVSNHGHGLYTWNSGNIVAKNSVFSFNGIDGISAQCCQSLHLENCTFSQNGQHGLNHMPRSSAPSQGYIYSNTFQSNVGCGMLILADGHAVSIENNSFVDNLCFGQTAAVEVAPTGHMTGNFFSNYPLCSLELSMIGGTGVVYDASCNFWNTTDESLIDLRIHDNADDINIATANFIPFAIASSCSDSVDCGNHGLCTLCNSCKCSDGFNDTFCGSCEFTGPNFASFPKCNECAPDFGPFPQCLSTSISTTSSLASTTMNTMTFTFTPKSTISFTIPSQSKVSTSTQITVPTSTQIIVPTSIFSNLPSPTTFLPSLTASTTIIPSTASTAPFSTVTQSQSLTFLVFSSLETPISPTNSSTQGSISASMKSHSISFWNFFALFLSCCF